jgi:hypothetical protein
VCSCEPITTELVRLYVFDVELILLISTPFAVYSVRVIVYTISPDTLSLSVPYVFCTVDLSGCIVYDTVGIISVGSPPGIVVAVALVQTPFL